jgi:bifunctional non-homologous end joining protein LigD
VVASSVSSREDRHGKVFLDSTRSGGATVVCAFSPRIRPNVPVSFPVPWADLEAVTPADFTLASVPDLLGGSDPWAERMPRPQTLPADLLAEGHEIPIARVRAMHEGKRRARAARTDT